MNASLRHVKTSHADGAGYLDDGGCEHGEGAEIELYENVQYAFQSLRWPSGLLLQSANLSNSPFAKEF